MRSSFHLSALLAAVVLTNDAAAQGSWDFGHVAAPWHENWVPQSDPDTDNENVGTANVGGYSWYTFCDGRFAEGTVDAWDKTAGSFSPQDEAAKVYMESWTYTGSLEGHLEGAIALRADCLINITGAASGGETVAVGAYTSNTEGTTDVAAAAARKTTGVTVWEGTFSLGLWSVTIPVYAVSGEGQSTGADEDGVFEYKCTKNYNVTCKNKVRVEGFADGNNGGPLVVVYGNLQLEITGYVTLCELPPEQCP